MYLYMLWCRYCYQYHFSVIIVLIIITVVVSMIMIMIIILTVYMPQPIVLAQQRGGLGARSLALRSASAAEARSALQARGGN